MTTAIPSQLKANGPFPLVDAKDVIGGFKSGVATLADRDAIPASFRAAGMRVPVLGDDGTGVTGRVFVLGADLTTWTGLPTSGEVVAPALDAVAREVSTRAGLIDADTEGRMLLGQAILALIRDAAGNAIAGWRQSDGALLTKLAVALGTSNGLSFAQQSDGSYLLSLGSAEGVIPVGGLTIDGNSETEDDLFVIKDAARNVIARVRKSTGTLITKLGIGVGVSNGLTLTQGTDGTYAFSLGTAEGQLPIGGATVDGAFDTDDDLFVLRDAAKNVVLRVKRADGSIIGNLVSPELVSARGTRTSLDSRLSQSLTAYGRPKGQFYQLDTLVETHRRLRTRKRGGAAQWVAAFVGDSWTHAPNYWIRQLALTMKATYGDAGPGWIGFGYPSSSPSLLNGNVDPSTVAVSYSGTFTPLYNGANSPDISSLSSSTAGDKVTITYTGAATVSAMKLFYLAGAGGVQYRWNGTGSYTAVDLSSGSGLGIAALTGIPAGNWTLEIQWTGAATLYGLDAQSTANGVRIHKLGGTGSRAQQWAAADATQWQAGLTALAPNFVQILLATNDQALYDANAFAGYVQTMVNRVRAAVPYADILLATPPENGLGRANPMASYAEAMGDLAAINGCAYLNLQPSFGTSYAQYGFASPGRRYFVADNTHPSDDGSDATLDAITTALRA